MERIEYKVRHCGTEYSDYLEHRFFNKNQKLGSSFLWKGHRWKYSHCDFDDESDFDVIYRNVETKPQVEFSPDWYSRQMFVARLQNMQTNGFKSIEIDELLSLLNDCDYLASSSEATVNPLLIENIPSEVLDAEATLSSYFIEKGIKEWKLGYSRNRF